MKLRYFKDPYVYFYILGIFGSNDLTIINGLSVDNNKFSTLKDCISFISNNESIKNQIKSKCDDDNRLIIVMEQLDDRRDSSKNCILHYCESAIFKFDKLLNLKEIIFDFRKYIEPTMDYATYDIETNLFIYNNNKINLVEFLQNDCLDKELAHYLLYENNIFKY